MKLNFTQIPRGEDGRVETPVLVLQTLSDKILGSVGEYFNLRLHARFNEVSEFSFDIPAYSHGVKTPLYDRITANKIVNVSPYGRFLVSDPSVSGDGVREVKTCVCKSLEYELTRARLILEEGTYSLYNPADSSNTLVGFIMELFPHWSVGSVSPTLYNRYRTFPNTDEKALDFLLNTAQQSYRCVFVFDTLRRTYDILDADADVSTIPVYLSYDNLIKNVDVAESIDEQFTVLDVRGAEPLDIRSVNPIGSNKLYNLDWFIENGDIPDFLASRWRSWETLVKANQAPFISYMTLYAAETSRLLTEQAKLSEEESALVSLQNIADVTLQGYAVGAKTQAEVTAANNACIAQEAVVSAQKQQVEAITESAAEYLASAKAISTSLSLSGFFTAAEISELGRYFTEDTFSDETFATFDVDISGDADTFLSSGSAGVSITGAKITEIALDASIQKRLSRVDGGIISVSDGTHSLSGNVVYCTVELDETNHQTTLSAYVGKCSVDGKDFLSGNLSVIGTDSSPSFGSASMSLAMSPASIYFTPNATEYQRLNTALELYDYAAEQLTDIAMPTYEFSVSVCNLLFDGSFKAFADELTLGSAVYLNLGDSLRVTPLLIEITLDFENTADFELVFSNRFRRPDKVNSMRDLLDTTYNASRSLDLSQYQYGAYHSSGAETQVRRLIESGLDAATAAVIGGMGNSVKIDGAGVTLRREGEDDFIRMNNGMIAFFDAADGTAKMALGKFVDPNLGVISGIVAPNIMGTLLAGEYIVIENRSSDGTAMLFKVDASGAFLHNSRFYLQHESGGKIALDPKYGIIAGTSSLYTLNGTTLTPAFVDADGSVVFDGNGMPLNTNFFIDGRNGNAYLRGTVYAENGSFTGDVTARNFYFADGDDVKTLLSDVQKQIPGEYLNVKGLSVQDGDGNTTFQVDQNGNVTLGGSITWNNATPQILSRFSSQQSIASGQTPLTDPNWHGTMLSTDKYRVDSSDGGRTWGIVYQFKGSDGSDATVNAYNVGQILRNNYNISSTAITPSSVVSPYIYSAHLISPTISTNDLYVYTATDTNSGGVHFINTLKNTEMLLIEGVVNSGGSYSYTSLSGTNLHVIADTLYVEQIGENVPGSYVTTIDLCGSFNFGLSGRGASIDFTYANITWGPNAPTAVFA